MVRFEISRVEFRVELHVELQRDMHPYPSSDVAACHAETQAGARQNAP